MLYKEQLQDYNMVIIKLITQKGNIMKKILKTKKPKGYLIRYLFTLLFVAITSLNLIVCDTQTSTDTPSTSNDTVFDISQDQALTGISKISAFSFILAGMVIVAALFLCLFTKESKKIVENIRWIITIVVVLVIIGFAANGKIYNTLEFIGNIFGVSWS